MSMVSPDSRPGSGAGQSHLNSLANDPKQVILLQARFEAFSLEAVLAGLVSTQEVQGQTPDPREVFRRMPDAVAERVLPEGDIQRPV